MVVVAKSAVPCVCKVKGKVCAGVCVCVQGKKGWGKAKGKGVCVWCGVWVWVVKSCERQTKLK